VPLYHTELEPSTTRRIYEGSCISFAVRSNITATVASIELFIHLRRKRNLARIRPPLHNIKTVDVPTRKASFELSRMPLAYEHVAYTVSNVNVARYTLDIPGVPLRPRYKSTIGTSDFTMRVNQPWQNIALTWFASSSLMTRVSWPRNPDACYASLRKLQRFSSILTLTGRKVPL